MLKLSFVKFKVNSYIFVEGAPATDRFFIIQSGHVRTYNEIALPGVTPESLGPGDFIGVVACMSGHEQPCSVVAVSDVVAIAVPREQYTALITANAPVAMKIVRSFARDMRIVNDALAKLTVRRVVTELPDGLYSVAELYDTAGEYNVAAYGYYQYAKSSPDGKNAESAKRRYLALSKAYKPPSSILRRNR